MSDIQGISTDSSATEEYVKLIILRHRLNWPNKRSLLSHGEMDSIIVR